MQRSPRGRPIESFYDAGEGATMNDSTSNPYAPPVAEVADVAAAGGLELASRGVRFGGALIDLVVQLLLLMLVNLVLPWSLFSEAVALSILLLNGLIGLVLFLAVNGYLLVAHGQTVGKRLLGTRIVRPDGSRTGAGRLLGLRYSIGYILGVIPFVNVIYGLVDSLMIFRASRRCLHDVIADTIVVKI